MKRLEVIANHSVEADIVDAVEKASEGKCYYTKIPVVFGKGNSNPKMGNAVWPEENFMIIIYTDEQTSFSIKNGIDSVKAIFPDEGIKYFEIG